MSRAAPAAAVPDRRTRPTSTWTGWGQWLALATMTLDHLARYALPADWNLSWASSSLGRIAFPLFAAMVAWHGLFNTRSPLRYARRILIIGLAAQLPYMLMPRVSDTLTLNVCFTLAAGLAWGSWLRSLAGQPWRGAAAFARLVLCVAASLVAWTLLGDWVEYGHRGLLLVPLFMLALHAFHEAGEATRKHLLAALPLLVVAGLMNSSAMAKSFTVATCMAILLLAAGIARHVPEAPLKMPRWLWLSWYPGHFLLIALWHVLERALPP